MERYDLSLIQSINFWVSESVNILTSLFKLILNTEGKTSCKQWHTYNWGEYKRALTRETEHIIDQNKTQHRHGEIWKSLATP